MPPELLQRMQELEQENGQLKQQETIKLAELELEKIQGRRGQQDQDRSRVDRCRKELHKEHISQSRQNGPHAAQTTAESARSFALEWKTAGNRT